MLDCSRNSRDPGQAIPRRLLPQVAPANPPLSPDGGRPGDRRPDSGVGLTRPWAGTQTWIKGRRARASRPGWGLGAPPPARGLCLLCSPRRLLPTGCHPSGRAVTARGFPHPAGPRGSRGTAPGPGGGRTGSQSPPAPPRSLPPRRRRTRTPRPPRARTHRAPPPRAWTCSRRVRPVPVLVPLPLLVLVPVLVPPPPPPVPKQPPYLPGPPPLLFTAPDHAPSSADSSRDGCEPEAPPPAPGPAPHPTPTPRSSGALHPHSSAPRPLLGSRRSGCGWARGLWRGALSPAGL